MFFELILTTFIVLTNFILAAGGQSPVGGVPFAPVATNGNNREDHDEASDCTPCPAGTKYVAVPDDSITGKSGSGSSCEVCGAGTYTDQDGVFDQCGEADPNPNP